MGDSLRQAALTWWGSLLRSLQLGSTAHCVCTERSCKNRGGRHKMRVVVLPGCSCSDAVSIQATSRIKMPLGELISVIGARLV